MDRKNFMYVRDKNLVIESDDQTWMICLPIGKPFDVPRKADIPKDYTNTLERLELFHVKTLKEKIEIYIKKIIRKLKEM